MIDHNQLCELEIEICSIAKFSTGIYDSASNQPEQLVLHKLEESIQGFSKILQEKESQEGLVSFQIFQILAQQFHLPIS